jgi:methionyl-tRNA synthetase
MPETSDTDFSWREFVRRNNDELVATYGNLVHRVLTFVYRNFDGHVPTYEDMGASNNVLPIDDRGTELDSMALSVFNAIFADNGPLYNCNFKQAIKMAMTVAHEANRYLDEKSPWKTIKEDRPAAATSLYWAICVISRLKTMFFPFLPFSSQKLHEYLGFEGKVEDYGWKPTVPPPGQRLLPPQPLFTKLDEELVETETSRLGQTYE